MSDINCAQNENMLQKNDIAGLSTASQPLGSLQAKPSACADYGFGAVAAAAILGSCHPKNKTLPGRITDVRAVSYSHFPSIFIHFLSAAASELAGGGRPASSNG